MGGRHLAQARGAVSWEKGILGRCVRNQEKRKEGEKDFKRGVCGREGSLGPPVTQEAGW